MSLLLLDPVDTLFFREGRAFGPEESADVSSVFPPPPTTLQGFVRSKLLADHCGRWTTFKNRCQEAGGPCERETTCNVQSVVGKYGETGSLVMRGPWLVVDGAAVLPVPADVMVDKDVSERVRRQPESGMETILLQPREQSARSSDAPGILRPLVPPAHVQEFANVGGWMSWFAWTEYLQGYAPTLQRFQNWWKNDDLWLVERRPGLAMEPGRNRSKDRHLYFAQHTRLRPAYVRGRQRYDVRIAIDCDGLPDDLAEGLVGFPAGSLGGEARAVRIQDLSNSNRASAARPWDPLSGSVQSAVEVSKRLKVVLLQPAWFTNGWYPEGWSPDTGTTAHPGWRWAGALVGRAQATGGWDLATRREKKVRPFVPAGSVFYIESSSAEASLTGKIWNRCLSESPGDQSPPFSAFGLGHALVGVWNES